VASGLPVAPQPIRQPCAANLNSPEALEPIKLMNNQLFGVEPWEPIMLTLAALMLGLSALLASAIPPCCRRRAHGGLAKRMTRVGDGVSPPSVGILPP